MPKNLFASILALAVMHLSTCHSAVSQEKEAPPTLKGEGTLQKLIRKFDRNGNGKLDDEERQALRKELGHLKKWIQTAKEAQKNPPTYEPVEIKIDPISSSLYKLNPGPLSPATQVLTLRDDARKKDLQIRVTWPKEEGSYPVIIWSHGAFGTRDHYQPLITHWASHGYVCVQADHADSRALGKPNVMKLSEWASRPKDVSLMIESLEGLAKKIPQLKNKLDRTRIGVGGHSFGAQTTQLVGGTTTREFPSAQPESHQDKRPLAFLLISAQGPGQMLQADSWKDFSRPALVITGTKDDSGRTGNPWTWRTEPYRNMPKGDKYLLVIDGAYHGFGGIAGPVRFASSGPENADHVFLIKSSSTALWDAYLKKDSAARAWLEKKKILAASPNTVTWETK